MAPTAPSSKSCKLTCPAKTTTNTTPIRFICIFPARVEKSRRFPNALLQFEDFSTPNAIRVLDRHHDELLCFNDDIQDSATVVLAGLFTATRTKGKKLSEMTFMFCGAGSAATGIQNWSYLKATA